MPRVIRTERILGWKGRVYQGLAYRIESFMQSDVQHTNMWKVNDAG